MKLATVKLRRNQGYRDARSLCLKLIAHRSVPILFALICFLILANTKCDKIGSTNAASVNEAASGASSASASRAKPSKKQDNEQRPQNNKSSIDKSQNSINSAMSKLDPLTMLREIYLDQNSKIVAMMEPGEGGDQDENINSLTSQLKRSVQKFHPNGRYGRRSVENSSNEPHSELAELVYNEKDADQSLRRMLSAAGRDYDLVPPIRQPGNRLSEQKEPTKLDLFYSNGAQVANYETEMKKLLKCNYTGLTNLYWCDN